MKPAKRNRLLLTFILLSLIAITCGKARITEETLIKVYVENTIVQEKYILNADSLRFHKQLVYNKYRITEKEFLEELSKYSDDKAMWEDFFKRANVYLNDLAKNGKLK